MYIKKKFKLLVQKDTTVSLLVDEVHLKLYFDYKGGNSLEDLPEVMDDRDE